MATVGLGRHVIRSGMMRSPFRPLPCTLASVRGVRRAWSHGGGALPEGTRTHRAACRRGLGAWLASLAGRSASRRSVDPRPDLGQRHRGLDNAGTSRDAVATVERSRVQLPFSQRPKRNVSKALVEAAILDKPASVSQLMARRRRNNSRNFWFWIICANWFISTVLTLLVWFLELCR